MARPLDPLRLKAFSTAEHNATPPEGAQTQVRRSGSSVGFAAHHVILLAVFFGWISPWTWVLSVAVAGGGAFWAWLYERSGSLLGPWLGHLLVDAAIFSVGWDLVR